MSSLLKEQSQSRDTNNDPIQFFKEKKNYIKQKYKNILPIINVSMMFMRGKAYWQLQIEKQNDGRAIKYQQL
ncbi:hypothetical protein TTHERM_01270190 (macronuclear) [Tetrahymena thermophila SB210]|uniref:Uncharacterized protein n=1 Tax=Tetrahymena thermophila (strain SB210) TaxID=312017 RepID=Q22QQ8_TETTS|nr:hypothetical protein TTHERM_01270190 [Tetrahymena thermophila SB210]EAR87614.1 hypothetical protein TTHERM_01270190 [Tetrahymena thermophila SB210]|eukprot:XP_001007859.1 hypothetical protein TTHERM_01270190 [Tetrahymena thermophila SB210]